MVATVRRSDAERNRARILEAAGVVLSDRAGVFAMAEVARQANVGMATLYRNFASLHDLLTALYAREVEDLIAAADAEADSPGDALEAWLRRFAVFHEHKHPIAAELLRHVDRSDAVFEGSRERVLAAGRPLLAAAQRSGEADEHLSVEQMLDLVLAVVTIPGDTAYVDSILTAAIRGLRA